MLIFLSRLLSAYQLLIFVWAMLSWIPSPNGQLVEFRRVLGKVVEPFVGIFRRFIPTAGVVDFSPFVAIIMLQLIQRLLL